MPFLILLFLLVAFYVVLLPRRRQMAAQRAATLDVAPGDTVLIGGCIYATLLDVEDGVARVEIAPGTVLEVVPRTFRKAVRPVPAGVEIAAEPDDAEADDGAPRHEEP